MKRSAVLTLAFAASGLAQVQITKPADTAVYVEQTGIGAAGNCQNLPSGMCVRNITVMVLPTVPATTRERRFQVRIEWPDLVHGGNATLTEVTQLFSMASNASVVFFYPADQIIIDLTHVDVTDTAAPVQIVYEPSAPPVCPVTPLAPPVVCPVLPTYPCQLQQYSAWGPTTARNGNGSQWVCGGSHDCIYVGDGKFVCPVHGVKE